MEESEAGASRRSHKVMTDQFRTFLFFLLLSLAALASLVNAALLYGLARMHVEAIESEQ